MSTSNNNDITNSLSAVLAQARAAPSVGGLTIEAADGEASNNDTNANLVDGPTNANNADDVALVSNSKLGVLQGATLEDIELGAEAVYVVDKRQRHIKSTMKSIKGLTTENIPAKTLRNWAVSLGIQMKKSFTKAQVIKCIITTKNFRERTSAGVGTGVGAETPTDGTPPTTRITINNVRFINVLAQDEVKARLLQRGAQKSREDLDNGVDPDAELYDLIRDTYNDFENSFLDVVIFLDVVWAKDPEPWKFTEITSAKAQTTLKQLSALYERCFSNWKTSGWHEGIPTEPFKKFIGSNNYLDYLHKLLEESPGLLSCFKGDLPAGVFSEGNVVTPRNPKRQKTNNNNNNISKEAQFERIADAHSEKAKIAAYGTHAEACGNLENKIEALKIKKKKALRELKETDEFLGKGSKYLKKYMDKLKRKRAGVDSENIENQKETQETQGSCETGCSLDEYRVLAEEYLDAEEEIKSKTKEVKTLKQLMSAYLKSLNIANEE